MIEFSGKLTGISKKYALKKISKRWQIFIFLCAPLSFPSAIILSNILRKDYPIFIPIVFLMLSFFPVIFKKRYESDLPEAVRIEKDTIVFEFSKTAQILPLEKIKKVYDHGDFYEMITFSPFMFNVLICQKELLSNGSLEDFETLFDGKIVQAN